ncbi:MAG: hypothetical protein Q4E28_03690 [Clostridia bacterium]|nr:hypothetical protein [Clostridia bacterium]
MAKFKDAVWLGNSKKMFDEIMDSLKPMYRAAVKKKVEIEFKRRDIVEIHEKDIADTIKASAPPKYVEMLMPIYEKYKSEE